MTINSRKHSLLVRSVRQARQFGAGFSVAQAGAAIRLRKLGNKSDAVRRELRRYGAMVGVAGGNAWGVLEELAAYGI